MHHPTDRITQTTAFVTPVVEHWLEREKGQWVRSMKDRSDDPSLHERTLLPRSYISLPTEKEKRLPTVMSSLFTILTDWCSTYGAGEEGKECLTTHSAHYIYGLRRAYCKEPLR